MIPKVGDHTNITLFISIVTYFCLTLTIFNVEDFLIRYIENLTIISNLKSKRKYNLTVGNMIAYILEAKYNISYLEEPDYLPSHFTDHSFHAFYCKKKRPIQVLE